MATSRTQQGRAYRDDQVERLFRDALATLTADGTPFADLSVGRLLDATGMARSTFYARFGDKGGMLRVLGADTLSRLYAAQRSWLDRGPGVTTQDIRAAMRRLLDAYVDDEAVMRAVAEASAYDPALREEYVAAVGDYARVIERFARRGTKEGWVVDCQPADTGTTLAWMTERTVSQLAPGSTPRRRDAIAETLARVVCAALFPGGRAPGDPAGGR